MLKFYHCATGIIAEQNPFQRPRDNVSTCNLVPIYNGSRMMPTAFAEDHLDPDVSARALDGGQVPSAAPVPSTTCSCTRTRAASLCSWGRWSACYQRGGPRLGERVLVGGAVRLSRLSQNQFGLPGTGGDACCSVPGRAAHVAASEPAPALNGRFRKMREFCGDLSCAVLTCWALLQRAPKPTH